jgi:CopG family nickel-responsive transcriptional regulator
MQRVTIVLDDELMKEVDRVAESKGYPNRSEVIRDLIRAGIQEEAIDEQANCVGVLSYIYNHEARDLARRLTSSHHHHHDISVCSLHVHLDTERCMEVSVLKGSAEELRHFADFVTSERTVTYGELKIIPN